MAIRKFTEQDFPAVCRIYAEAKFDELRFESAVFNITPLDQDAVILAAFQESSVLVFEADEVLAFTAMHGRQLRALFVRRDARGAGIRRALLAAASATINGSVLLNVAKSNHGVRKFYEDNGFVLVGETDKKYQGIPVAYLEMASIPHHAG